MSSAVSQLSSESSVVPGKVDKTAGRLRASQVVEMIGGFEGRLEVVEKGLGSIKDAGQLAIQIQTLTKRLDAQEIEIQGIRKNNNVLRADNEFLKDELKRISEACCDNTTDEDSEVSEEEVDEKKVSLTKKIEEEIEGSSLAYGDNALKELTRYAFNFCMGIARFSENNPPVYPDTDDKSTWPKIQGTDDAVLRFRWDRAWTDEDNYHSIRWLMGWMKRHGSGVVPSSKLPLLRISEEDLQKRVRERFNNLRKKVKAAEGTHKESGTENQAGGLSEGGDGGLTNLSKEGMVKVEGRKGPSTAGLRSRAAGKLAIRKMQRDKLPADSPYRDPKYDPAFVVNLMSDDEDEYNENGKTTKRFISRAPLYRSQELIKLLATIDAVPFEGPKRYLERVRGLPIDVPPKRSNKMELKARRWMIDEAWLAKPENQKWDDESRIVDSGKAWGDDNDPEDIAAQHEEIKLAKKALAIDKKRRLFEVEQERETKKAKKDKKREKGKKRMEVKMSSTTPASDTADIEDDDIIYD
ncbi:hypothetical protein C0992_003535 [Termitomyces sp. T32_za158]|nr:hypothetical protein C0992_003535 [Termitomyces sp. T32_za158]